MRIRKLENISQIMDAKVGDVIPLQNDSLDPCGGVTYNAIIMGKDKKSMKVLGKCYGLSLPSSWVKYLITDIPNEISIDSRRNGYCEGKGITTEFVISPSDQEKEFMAQYEEEMK